jgi:plastocyanin
MIRPKILNSIPFLGVVLFIFCVGFPPFDDLTTVNLSVHMLEHILIILAGAMIGYPLYRRGTFARVPHKVAGPVAVVVVAVIFFYWHLPGPWDAAVLNPLIHAVEHFSFLLSGILIGGFFPMLSDGRKIDVLALGFGAHILYGLALIFSYQIYPLYSVYQQLWLGIWVFMPTPLYLYFIVLYTVIGNNSLSRELGEQFGLNVAGIRQNVLKFSGSARKFVPIVSLCMLLVLGGYFTVAGATVLTTTAPPSQHGDTSIVYILETPVTWDYSPPHIVVVIGVNNTVTWVSKSLAYDTITSINGDFNSGDIPPGGTYTYTFTDPGNYSYNCIFHPWMKGTVTVLSGP